MIPYYDERMKDFGLTEEQKEARRTAERFAANEIAPVVEGLEKEARYPVELVDKLGKLGYLGAIVPTEYGGAGLDYLSYGIICEEIARVDWVLASVISVQNSLINTSIINFGTEEQKKNFLTPLASGEKKAAACLTEPCGGTDLASLETTAVKKGDEYVLNGSKIFISHAQHSQVFYVLATVDRSKRHGGICAFLVDSETPGITVKPVPMHTLRRDNICEVHFEDAVVPAKNLLGEEGGGFKVIASALDMGRFSVASRCVGGAQASLDASVKYAMERKQFGVEIGRHQLIQGLIADMITSTSAARLLVYRLGELKQSGIRRASMEASMAKLFASEVNFNAANSAIQIHGGYGLAEEFPVGRYLLEAKVLHIGEGTSQLQRILVAEYALGIRKY